MIIYRFQGIQTSRDPSLSIFMLLEPYGVSSPPYKDKAMGHEIPTSQRKRIKKINASYNLEGTVLDNVENIKYLGVTF